jgi:hypothetical protein
MPATPCFYHGRDNLDLFVTFSIGGRIWDYYLSNPTQLDACEHIAKHVGPLKGLNYAKKRAVRMVERAVA